MISCANPGLQFESYKNEIESAVLRVMRSNSYILSAEVSALEIEFADYIGTKYSIGVGNGTDAIEISLRALEIGYGDEVITVSHTATATVAAIEATGAKAVLVDIEPQFYTMNPMQLDEVITENTKAVVAVHLYGQSVDLDKISQFCSKNKIFLIEDVSQAHGAKHHERCLGSIGDIGCFSCYPTKNLGALGDAGLITTSDQALEKKIRMIREYGWVNRESIIPGRNSRLDEIQAAILRIKLKYLDLNNKKRRSIAQHYKSELDECPIVMPEIRVNSYSVFHLFVVQTDFQKEILSFLNNLGIQAGVHYPLPIHLNASYKNVIKTAKNMSETEIISKKIISLPMYPELTANDVDKVINGIFKFYNSH